MPKASVIRRRGETLKMARLGFGGGLLPDTVGIAEDDVVRMFGRHGMKQFGLTPLSKGLPRDPFMQHPKIKFTRAVLEEGFFTGKIYARPKLDTSKVWTSHIKAELDGLHDSLKCSCVRNPNAREVFSREEFKIGSALSSKFSRIFAARYSSAAPFDLACAFSLVVGAFTRTTLDEPTTKSTQPNIRTKNMVEATASH